MGLITNPGSVSLYTLTLQHTDNIDVSNTADKNNHCIEIKV